MVTLAPKCSSTVTESFRETLLAYASDFSMNRGGSVCRDEQRTTVRPLQKTVKHYVSTDIRKVLEFVQKRV